MIDYTSRIKRHRKTCFPNIFAYDIEINTTILQDLPINDPENTYKTLKNSFFSSTKNKNNNQKESIGVILYSPFRNREQLEKENVLASEKICKDFLENIFVHPSKFEIPISKIDKYNETLYSFSNSFNVTIIIVLCFVLPIIILYTLTEIRRRRKRV